MEAATVVGLVTALVETFADGHADYDAWKQRRFASNHYRGRGYNSSPCALSTTLSIAGRQIQETYEKGLAIVGAEFSTGDFNCRSMLWSQLNVLSDRVANLHRAASATSWAIVDLADATSVCEDVRRASLHALSDQYYRILAGRPVPKALSVVRPRLQPTVSAQSEESLRPKMVKRPTSESLRPPKYQVKQYRMSQQQPKPQPYQQQHHVQPRKHHSSSPIQREDDEDEKILRAYIGGPLRIQQNEPPSPPLTPKTSDNGSDSSSTAASRPGGNSVFAQFCGEAMALQVDTTKPVPASGSCACGYEWHEQLHGRRDAGQLKEGFKLTTRYLAKSHVGTEGFGCVLCTSSGRSERFEGVELLKEHINSSHTKWQLLHDADCRASSKLADGFW